MMIENKQGPFAEIIESSLIEWTGQSWQWDQFPAFGSVVTLPQGSKTLVGVIHKIKTGSIDPTRYPIAYKKTERELKEQMPHIFEFLTTNFFCIALGYIENNKACYATVPKPPKIHSFIWPASATQLSIFFYSPEYLHTLFASQSHIENIDELLVSLLIYQKNLYGKYQEHLSKAVKTYSLLTNNDYKRTRILLQRISQQL